MLDLDNQGAFAHLHLSYAKTFHKYRHHSRVEEGDSRNSLFFGDNLAGRQLRDRDSSGKGKHRREAPVNSRLGMVIPEEILWSKVGLDQHRRTVGMVVGCMPS
jgi:hypothetical protein